MSEDAYSIEADLNQIRSQIELLKQRVCSVFGSSCFSDEDILLDGANIPDSRHANMKANLTLSFRHLEDARMRIGKVLQAHQGGISILDRDKVREARRE